tara:strand:+ start:1442 stop:2383 length:942 start_codon:yes stop_codon:yes gene_type:complete
MHNYYEVLQINSTATQLEIKKAYKKLALKYHPDKNGGTVDQFILISEAYQVLSDSDSRSMYDKNREVPIDFKDAQEVFNQMFDSMDPIIGQYLKSTLTQFKDDMLNGEFSAGDILKSFTKDTFIDRTTDTINKYIKKKALNSCQNFYEHIVDVGSIVDNEYILNLNIDFLRKYAFIKLTIDGDSLQKTFLLNLMYTDFTVKFQNEVYNIVIYNEFPENLHNRGHSNDLELLLPINISNYISGFNYKKQLTTSYYLDLNIKTELSNVVKLPGLGIVNNKGELGNLYIILIPNSHSDLLPKLKLNQEIITSLSVI